MLACICGFSIEAIILTFTISLAFIVDRFVCWCKICGGSFKKCKTQKVINEKNNLAH